MVFGPPGYAWKLSPVRDTLEDLKLTIVRMQLCHFGIRLNMQDNTPSGDTTTGLDWYGQTVRHAEWRAQARITLIRHPNDRILGTSNTKHGNVSVYLNTYTRTDHNIHHYVTTNKAGPKWSDVIRRVTINLDTNTVVQEIAIADQPTGYDWHAPLPEGVANISTRMYWQPEEP
eukprot:7756398-Pyramimonas_sp.AAC.1